VPITVRADIDPNCGQPALKITKKLIQGITPQPPFPGFAWGSTVAYEITLENVSTTANVTNVQLSDLLTAHDLGDFVSGGIGTPAFTAQVVDIACLSWICSGTAPAAPGGLEPVAGYLNRHWMVGTNIVPTFPASLGPGQHVSFQLKIKYTNPECDSYPDVTEKPILNFIRAKYFDPTLGGNIILQSAPAVALFEAPQPCNFKVTKLRDVNDPAKIIFGQNIHYTVTYKNLDAQPVTIGTMIDALRIVQPNTSYASPLTVHYDYNCTTTTGVTGFSAVGGVAPFTFPFTIYPPQTVQVVPTSLPQMGVRIIQNTAPVYFPGNSSVTCAVRISVDKPVGASQCARVGELENAAIMDTSAYYNANLPWGDTIPGFAANVSLPLPQCFDLVVNKGVNRIWTPPNGGPLVYDLTISNLGDPIIPSDQVSLTDIFSPSFVPSYLANNCTVNGVPALFDPQLCNFDWSPPSPPGNPSTLAIQGLGHLWAAIPSFKVSGPYPAPYPALPGQVCNDAVATLTGLNSQDWYAKDPLTWKTQRCVPIFSLTTLRVSKSVSVVAPALPPPPTSFTVNVNCLLPNYYVSNQTLTFNYPPTTIPSQNVQNIPYGSNTTCTIVEQPVSTTPIANKGCASGFAAWGPITYPNALGPDGTSQSLAIALTGNALEVHNTFACVPPLVGGPVDLGIAKTVMTNPAVIDTAFILTVTNVGPAFTGTNVITVSDPMTGFSGTITSISGSPNNNWTCNGLPLPITTPVVPPLNCTYTGSGPIVGQVLDQIVIHTNYNAITMPPFENCTTVGVTSSSGLQDSYLPNNTDCKNVGTHPPPPTPTTSPTPTPTPVSCIGDCNGNGQVTVDEILTLVNIALGNANVSTCRAGDANHDNKITVDEILTAVNNALNGCSGG
jgi:hypothetical protein